MKYYFFLLICVLISNISCGNNDTSDSVLFSQDGKSVLIKQGKFLNGCDVDWWGFYRKGSDEREYYVAFSSDSVFFLSYSDTLKSFPVFPCNNTDIRIAKKITKLEFNIEFNFSLSSYKSIESLTFNIDTIKTYYRPNKQDSDGKDSTKYSEIRIMFYLSNHLIFIDTVSTNGTFFNLTKDISAYKVFFSSDTKYYFIYGQYGYCEFPSAKGGVMDSVPVYSRKIGQKYW